MNYLIENEFKYKDFKSKGDKEYEDIKKIYKYIFSNDDCIRCRKPCRGTCAFKINGDQLHRAYLNMVYSCSLFILHGFSAFVLDWEDIDGRGKSIFICVWLNILLLMDCFFHPEIFKKSAVIRVYAKLFSYFMKSGILDFVNAQELHKKGVRL